MKNPSLNEYTRDRRASIVPSKSSVSILDWLRQQGRLIEEVVVATETTVDEDIEDIDELIGDDGYDDDDYED
ncbi:MAG: DUF3134 family protein [Synechococcaceae cyanobacterium SM2_3_2]|jgi:hypothetical protein|nr:DUF3134 family protein [Synechococcaceae cyanobacterium SM2_3_2]